MAIDLATVGVKLEAKGMAQVKGAFADVSKEANNIKTNLTNLLSPTKAVAGALAGIGAGITATAVIGLFKSTIDSAREAEDKVALLRVAVDNAGQSYKAWTPELDKAADGLEKVTRFSDESARGALSTLVTVTGNVTESIKNLGLVADFAAFKHIDLNDAALLVGKAMNGNVTALKKMGISATDGADAIQKLREKVQGFATADAQTLTGALDQTANAWDNVKEAMGRAILGTGDMTGKTNGLRDSLVSLEAYISENAESWQRWARNLTDPNWGPAKILNSIADWATKAGLALHGIATQDFSALEKYMKGSAPSFSPDDGDHLGGLPHSGSAPSEKAFVYGTGKEKKGKDANKALSEQITLLGKALVFDDIRAKAETQLAVIETELAKKLKATNLTFAERIKLEEDLASVQNARAEGTRIDKMMTLPTGPTISVTPNSDPSEGEFPGLDNGPMKNIPEKMAKVPEIINESGRKAVDAMNQLDSQMQAAMGSLSTILGDGIYNAFAAAFNGEGLGGVFKAFGKTVLAGIGSIFQQMGSAYLSYGLIMTGLIPSLANPFTSGPTAIAIGVALTALGGALGAIAGGHSRGAAGAANTGGNYNSGGQQMTTLKFVDRQGRPVGSIQPIVNNFAVIGPNDPAAQRAIDQMIKNSARR